MQLDIDGSSLVRRPAVWRHIETEVTRQLGRFADRIATVRIRLGSPPPSESTRTLCGIGVTLEPHDEGPGAWLLARVEDADAWRAIDRAVQRVAQAVSNELRRRDQEQAARARALLAFSQTGTVEQV